LGTVSAGWTGTFSVLCQVQLVPSGTALIATAAINPISGDGVTANNTRPLVQFVGYSFDPNEKASEPEGRIVRSDDLRYFVEFQNTGTDTAEVVVVRDVLDPNLDPSTIDDISSSHPFDVEVSGQEITWTFEGINLPDSTANEPESHGAIEFTVLPYSTVPDGATIENHASIYFDLNEPVITNSTLNVIDSPPVLAAIADVTVEAGQVADQALSATDPENDPITFSLLSGPSYATVTTTGPSTGNLHVTPGPTDSGPPVEAVIQASDGLLAVQATIRITVTCSTSLEFDLTPNTLNLHAMGHWVTAYLETTPPLTPADIDVASIRLNGTVPVDPAAPSAIGDHDGDGIPDLMVKFNRAAVELTVDGGDLVPVSVGGLAGGQCFQGTDNIRVLRAVVSAPAGGATLPSGATTPVQWTTPAGVNIQSVAVLSSIDGGATWNLDAKGLPNNGSYSWVVPSVATQTARVAVVLVESADESGYIVEGVLGTSGTFAIQATTGVESGTRNEFSLRTVSPSAMQQAMRVMFSLPDARPATIEVFSVSGRRVAIREVGSFGPGSHTVTLGERTTLPSGVYIVRLSQGGKSLTKRAVVVR